MGPCSLVADFIEKIYGDLTTQWMDSKLGERNE
jgi:hypothetical protein